MVHTALIIPVKHRIHQRNESCLSRLVTNLTGLDHKPKGQEFGCTFFEDLLPISNTQDNADIDIINVLDTEIYDVESLQQQDAYCKPIRAKYIYPQSNINSP